MERSLNLVGRILLAHIFILSGLGKISGYAGTAAYMESMGVPGALLPVVIAAELLGGLALVVGYQTRWAALGLAVFSILSALIFHNNVADQAQMINFMKNLSIAGGLLVLAQIGASVPSFDSIRSTGRARPLVR